MLASLFGSGAGASPPALLTFHEGVQASLIECSGQAVVWTGLDVEIVGAIAAGLLSSLESPIKRLQASFLAHVLGKPGN